VGILKTSNVVLVLMLDGLDLGFEVGYLYSLISITLFKASDELLSKIVSFPLACVHFLQLSDLNDLLSNLELVDARLVLEFDIKLDSLVVDLFVMLPHHLFDLACVPLVDLGSHLFPDVVIQMLNLFEDAPLQLGLGAGAVGQIVVAFVVAALVLTRLISEVFDNQELLLQDLLDVDDLDLEGGLVKGFSVSGFFLKLPNRDLLGHE